MKRARRWFLAGLLVLGAATVSPGRLVAADALPSWNEGATKASIVRFVERTTRAGSPDFVVPAERIAAFDNDGTLWAERPMYFQLLFMLDHVKELEPQHPEWKTHEPFASILKGDVSAALAGGERTLVELAMATHAGMTSEEFARIVDAWIASAKHPITGRPYTEMVYQPMLEILAYLRAPARVAASVSMCTTPTPSASRRMTATRASGAWTKVSTKRSRVAGRWWT